MKSKIEGILEIIVALVALFSSLWDPRVSVIVAVAALIVFGTIRLLKDKQVVQKVENENKNQ
jgi:hypothetical protein